MNRVGAIANAMIGRGDARMYKFLELHPSLVVIAVIQAIREKYAVNHGSSLLPKRGMSMGVNTVEKYSGAYGDGLLLV